jgi:hypothetical protein
VCWSCPLRTFGRWSAHDAEVLVQHAEQRRCAVDDGLDELALALIDTPAELLLKPPTFGDRRFLPGLGRHPVSPDVTSTAKSKSACP